MTANLKRVLPPGHADAHCLVCRRDVVIPAGTLACPNGDHEVEPTSLAHMPEPERPTAVQPLPAVLTIQGDRREPPARLTPPQPQQRPAPEPIEIPDIGGALDWYADTQRLCDQLIDEEIQLQRRLKQVKAMRHRLGQIVGLFVAPSLETDAAPIVEEIAEESAPEPLPTPAAIAPPVDATPEAPTPTRWAPNYDACTNCGTTSGKHAAGGRCRTCYSYWNQRGSERPESLWRKPS